MSDFFVTTLKVMAATTIIGASAYAIPSPVSKTQPIILYSVAHCGVTQRYTQQLEQNHISYIYKDINAEFNAPHFADTIEPRLTHSGIDPANISGPVVDIKGHFYVNPTMDVIKAKLSSP